jgi:hypothetical protein
MSLIKFTNQIYKPLHKNIFYVEKKVEGVESVEVALQYADDVSSRVMAFANNISNPEGGTHVTGFKTALTRTLNTYAKNNNLAKGESDSFTGDDALEGLTADYDSATSARGHGNSFLTGYDGYLCILAHTNTFVKYHARTSYLWISYLRKLNMCHT